MSTKTGADSIQPFNRYSTRRCWANKDFHCRRSEPGNLWFTRRLCDFSGRLPSTGGNPDQRNGSQSKLSLEQKESSATFQTSTCMRLAFKVWGQTPTFPSVISYNQHIAHTDLHDELVRLIQVSLSAGHAPAEICVVAPWWVLLASTTRKLVAMLPDQQFDGPGLVPFSNDLDNFWFKLSKILLTQSSPHMLNVCVGLEM